MDKHLQEHYRLKIDEKMSIGSYEAFRFRNVVYTIVPITNMEHEEIVELKQMSDYLISTGERNIASIVPTASNSLLTSIDDQGNILLLQMPTQQQGMRGNYSLGSQLAGFHEKGRRFPYQVNRSNRIGQWKKLWEQRLDQMEIFCDEKVRQHPSSYFEKLLVESFPYYIGLTENAIQYLVDTELDDQPIHTDSATICHHRFTRNTWLNERTVFPIDWVYDHASRDLAEWIRGEFTNQYKIDYNEVFKFTRDYERVTRLSTFSWRLLYSRLLFPVHYFESIEGYYLSSSEAEKKQYEIRLSEHLKRSTDYELFLKEINHLIRQSRNNTSKVPQVGWL
ncbi:spore coat protein YutH [Bacillus luteolus]|uniref:Spore coat protein YutH n=1 Tax=Litchfieldia luteola TaxID=682179 RepID=A0ABR9QFZ3_9BACI|nr:spore coat protein YutH [Cytobacillus luteolus]MBE4907412.1 spore coat protein YutH [Cytobacillus luteolus]MBP1944178.1 spore coat protein YutH [Cytobacillus luteolus]